MKTSIKDNMDFLGAKNISDNLNKNEWLLWCLRIILVIYAAFIAPNLNESLAKVFDNVIFRIVWAASIVYVCYIDPALAILLAVGFVVSIQTMNKHKVNQIANSSAINGPEPALDESTPLYNTNESFSSEEEEGGSNDYNNTNEESETFATQPMQDNMQQNALASGGACPNQGTYFTTKDQLVDAQNNNVQTNQMSQVQTWSNELGPQGLNAPYGYSGPNASAPDATPGIGQFAAEF